MKIALSPDNVTHVEANCKGEVFSFDIKHFSLNELEKYERLTEEAIENKSSVADLLKKRWDFAIKNCTLENPFDMLSIDDVKTVLVSVAEVNTKVDEKKS